MRGLEASARDALDRRLAPAARRPLAVALSGGGDSLALTLIADTWAREHGRELLVLTVDHRLQSGSATWTIACAAIAERLGRPFRALAWAGAKPRSGLPAAARAARHRLLAAAAREAGAQVILMGHTADDILEARLMRQAGATTPDPRAWAPSPVWPEGRGLFVLRPLLEVRRAELRAWLEARGEPWIDDPANTDLRYARARARPRAADAEPPRVAERPPLSLAVAVAHAHGALSLARAALRSAEPQEAARLLAIACVCAGGGERRPAGERLARAAAGVQGEGRFVATLAGARIEAGEDTVQIAREPGETARGGLKPRPVPPGREVIWDGRFAVSAAREGLVVRGLAGVAARLSEEERRRLRDLPAPLRGGLPAILEPDGRVTCPALGGAPGVEVRSLVPDRFQAAAGLVTREPD